MPDAHQLRTDIRRAVSSGADHAQQWVTPRSEGTQRWVESVSPKVQRHVQQVARRGAEEVVTVTPKFQEAIDRFGPKLSHAVDEATPKLARTLEKAPPALKQAKDKVVDQYLPHLSSSLGNMAEKLSDNLDEAGDHASRWVRQEVHPEMKRLAGRVDETTFAVTKSGRRAVEKAQKAAQRATDEAVKQFQKEQKRAGKSSGKGWLVAGLVAAGGAAAVAIWKAMRPQDEDLWTPPEADSSPSAGAHESQEGEKRSDKHDKKVEHQAAGRPCAKEATTTTMGELPHGKPSA